MTKQVAKIKVLNHQKEFALNKHQFPCLVGGLGAGKTEAAIYRVIKFILDNKNTKKKTGDFYKFGIYMPNNGYFKKNIIPNLEKWMTKLGIEYELNKSDFIFKVEDYAIIYMISLDAPKKIVSYEMHDSWIDELDILSYDKAEDSFNKVNTRNRAKKINRLVDGKIDKGINTLCVTTTPDRGTRGFTYRKWVKEVKENPRLSKLYDIKNIKTKTNCFLPDDYIIKTFSSYPKNEYLAMAEGQFVDYTSMPVYSQYDRRINNTDKIWEGEKIHIGMDFNINNMSAVIGIFKYENGKNTLYIVDEIYSNSYTKKNIRDTPEMILEIKKRYPNADITIYPDAAGNQRNSINFNTTNVKLLKENFKVNLNYITSKDKPVNPRIEDRVSTVNTCFKSILNETVLYINLKTCEKLVYNLENQGYKEKGYEYVIDKDSGMDHMLDALGYLVYYEFRKTKSKTQTISKRI